MTSTLSTGADPVAGVPTVSRSVVFDVITWKTPTSRPDKFDYHIARLGETVELSEEEAARLEALGAVGTPREAAAAQQVAAEGATWPQEQLDSANVADTVAYMTQHPSEAAAVLESEQSRESRGKGKPRVTVMQAAERVDAAYQEALDAQQSDAVRQAELAEEIEQGAYERSQGGAGDGAPSIPPAG